MLVVALVVLPPAAYVTGALAGADDEAPVRPAIVLRPSGESRTPEVSGTPTRSPEPSPTVSDDPGRCEDDDDDDDDVIIPCPEDDDDDDRGPDRGDTEDSGTRDDPGDDDLGDDDD